MSQLRTLAVRRVRLDAFSSWPISVNLLVFMMFAALILVVPASRAQAGKDGASTDPDDAVTRLRIEVTGGDQNKPVPDASVYVKFSDERKIRRDKKYELALKTSEQGVTRTPEIPQGRILIQVVAPGWKTYGEWHDIKQNEQTIAIHLVRPVKPY